MLLAIRVACQPLTRHLLQWNRDCCVLWILLKVIPCLPRELLLDQHWMSSAQPGPFPGLHGKSPGWHLMCLAGKTHSDLSQPLGINAACVLSLSVMWALCNVGHTSWLHMLTGHTRCFSPDLDIQENLLGLGFPKLSLGRGQLLPESCFPPIMVIPRLSHTHNYRSLGDCLRSRWVILWCLREVNFSSSVWKFMGPAVRLQCTPVCSFSHRCKLGSGCKKNLTTLKVSPEVWSKGWWKLLHVGLFGIFLSKGMGTEIPKNSVECKSHCYLAGASLR